MMHMAPVSKESYGTKFRFYERPFMRFS